MSPFSDQPNRIDLRTSFRDFKDPRLSFSVSSRKIRPDIDILDYLRIFYMYCEPRRIESVFGNTSFSSRLYGGRATRSEHELTERHLQSMAENGIHLALTMTNHYFDDTAYRESRPLLERHHVPGNSIICTNDRLAARLKRDFPLYEIKASIIKNIDTLDKVKRALDLYHSLTLPMDKNDDDEFLDSLPEKGRVLLFGNANCAYTCPARTCYLGFSQENFGKPVTSVCSQETIRRLDKGHVFFNVAKLADMGFTRFKLVPLAPRGSIIVCRKLSWEKGYLLNPIKKNKEIHYLCSYPKCGRTWLRFILANYFNLLYGLGLAIDLRSFFSLMPTDDRSSHGGIGGYLHAADSRFPLLLASHNYYARKRFGSDPNSRIVFIFRSIPDVIVSEYFHRSRFMKVYNGGLKDFIRDAKSGLAGYCRYLNSWAPIVQTGRPLAVTYEMLHADAEGTAAGVLSFLNIPVDEAMLREALSLSSFQAMQKLEKERGIHRPQASTDDPEDLRVRKGKVGGGLPYLDPDDLDYIQRTSQALLTDSAHALLRQYRLGNLQGRRTEENPS